VRGHTLVWHNQLPAWLTQGSFSNAELRDLLRQHVSQVVRRYRGRISEWDVVNEAFNEDGTLRDTPWLRALGPDYLAQVFRWAHRADPSAKLYINDYNVESINPKSTALYNLVRDLRSQGVPVDGVGLQAHLSLQYPFPGDLSQNIRRFAAMGVDVAITEADVRMPLPVTAQQLAEQADYYAQLMQSCLGERRCVSLTVWGFTDAYSWVPGWFPGEGAATPLDENYQPKPAYDALRDVLSGAR
jgi:endo-1,4-beta-xylanase